MAVRLDPWQNIVNVSWSNAGGGGGGSAGPTQRPGFRGGACATVHDLVSVDVDFTWSILEGGGPTQDGELLLAHVAAGEGSTIIPPNGWDELYQSTIIKDSSGLPRFTAGAFIRIKQPGDPDVFTFTQSSNTGMAAAASAVIRADDSPSATPDALTINHTQVGQTADSLPTFIQPELPLILAFVDTDNESFLQQNYPEPPNPVWFVQYRCRDGSFSHGMMMFLGPFPVFTGPDTLPATGFSGSNFGMTEIVTIAAFAPA